MDIKQEYLKAAFPAAEKRSVSGNVKLAFANPLAQIALVGVVLVMVQMLAMSGMISSSFAYALGNTLIYAIVAIGFCLLLGYSGLASLGTAGFIGLGAYAAFYIVQGLGAPYFVALLVTLAVSVILGIAVGFISLRVSILRSLPLLWQRSSETFSWHCRQRSKSTSRTYACLV